jgi:hypothetical protein
LEIIQMGGIVSVQSNIEDMESNDAVSIAIDSSAPIICTENDLDCHHCEKQPCDQETKTQSTIDHVAVLLHPHFNQFLDFEQLTQLCLLNKYYLKTVKGNAKDLGYWQSMCNSLSARRGLYCPTEIVQPREFFFRELWPCNRKWQSSDADGGQNFRIRVGSRFRPGTKSQNRFALPLHQFLKVRAQQQSRDSSDKNAIFVGDKTPEQYLDPLLGTLMVNPVLLPHSRRVIDRSVARASKQDPFSGTPLVQSELIDLPDLANEIVEFRKKQFNVDISIDSQDAMGLVDSIDPKLLEAMVAVDQLNCAAERLLYDASHNNSRRAGPGEDVGGAGGAAIEGPEQDEDGAAPLAQAHNTHFDNDRALSMEEELLRDDEFGRDDARDGSSSRDGGASGASRWGKAKHDTARLIDVNGDTATVTMNVPGTGVRPFNFNQVFPDRDGQLAVYTQAARDIVVSALNGTNGCLLCYGQTGSGKTHTMFGPPDGSNPLSTVEVGGANGGVDSLSELNNICNGDNATGIVMRACAELLRAKLQFSARGEVTMIITAQFVEIYNETVTDLMTGRRVSIRRGTGEVSGALEVPVHCLEDAADLLRTGNLRKHFAATAMNDRSSRSHTALILHTSQTHHSTNMHVKSHLYLVDLAGSG